MNKNNNKNSSRLPGLLSSDTYLTNLTNQFRYKLHEWKIHLLGIDFSTITSATFDFDGVVADGSHVVTTSFEHLTENMYNQVEGTFAEMKARGYSDNELIEAGFRNRYDAGIRNEQYLQTLQNMENEGKINKHFGELIEILRDHGQRWVAIITAGNALVAEQILHTFQIDAAIGTEIDDEGRIKLIGAVTETLPSGTKVRSKLDAAKEVCESSGSKPRHFDPSRNIHFADNLYDRVPHRESGIAFLVLPSKAEDITPEQWHSYNWGHWDFVMLNTREHCEIVANAIGQNDVRTLIALNKEVQEIIPRTNHNKHRVMIQHPADEKKKFKVPRTSNGANPSTGSETPKVKSKH